MTLYMYVHLYIHKKKHSILRKGFAVGFRVDRGLGFELFYTQKNEK